MVIRAGLHYLLVIVVMTVYGGRVCPFVEGLGIRLWAVTLAGGILAAFIARWFLAALWVEKGAYEHQVRRQFLLEFILVVLTGAGLALFNHYVRGFPGESGVKQAVGTAALGFFLAADLSLARERIIAAHFRDTGQELMVGERFFPMTGRFALVAAISAACLALVIFLVVSKDLYWIMFESEGDIMAAQRSVLKEVGFVSVVILAYVFNLIISYSGNLKMFFHAQNSALKEASLGRLNSFVPVASRDEIGVMAHYTNQMIDSLRDRTEELQLTRDVTILTLASLAETRDNETGAHILRTQRYVRALAEELKGHDGYKHELTRDAITLLFKSAPLHDVGKVGVPDAILLKPGRLTEDEFEQMKKHAEYGRQTLQTALGRMGESSFLRLAAEIAYTHHEKWNGTGYPKGLAGEEIPVSGRLMALADVYDALISKRVYKPAFPHDKAKEIIIEGRGSHFDPCVVDAFLRVEDQFLSIAAEYADDGPH